MRKLMWFTIGFGFSCLVLAYVPEVQEYIFPAGLVLGCSFLFLLFSRKIPRLKLLSLLLAGAGIGCLWCHRFDTSYLEPAAKLDGALQPAVISTTDYSFETGYGLAVDGTMELDGKTYQVRAYLEDGEELPPGRMLEGTFRFRLTTPDGKQGATSHSGKGIFLLAYQKGEVSVAASGEDNFTVRTAFLRRKIEIILHSTLSEDSYPFTKALLLGDVSDLPYETDTILKVSGIRHVAAVSGLHVSILFALLSTITFKNRYLTVLFGIPVLAVFAALAGFTPSVVRACLMSGLMLIGLLLNREYDGGTGLSFAVLMILLINPLTITSVSFQLSVASVAGIFLFSGKLSEWFTGKMGDRKGKSLQVRLKRWFAASVTTSTSAMVLTVPLCAWYFGTVSLVSVVTNLLTLWVISILFYTLLGVIALSFVNLPTAAFLGKLAGFLVWYVLGIAKLLSQIPFACVYTASVYVVFWLIFVYVLLVVFFLFRKRRTAELVCGMVLSLCAALLCSYTESNLYGTVITVLDVGQGQCVLLQSEGKAYLVDCGGDDDKQAADTAAAYLLSRGIRRLDGLILTHTDRDHAGGAEHLLTRVEADVLILPSTPMDWKPGKQRFLVADRELHFRWNSSEIRIYGEKIPESNNENSVCILLDTEKCDILITGDRNADGEARLLQNAEIPEVDVLVAGHHGSKFAASEELLKAVSPEVVCISVGADNIYGHPAKETLARLQDFNCSVYRTDRNGNIIIRRRIPWQKKETKPMPCRCSKIN